MNNNPPSLSTSSYSCSLRLRPPSDDEFLYRWRISNVGKEEYSWIINLRGIIKKKFLRNYSKPFPEFLIVQSFLIYEPMEK